MENQDSSKKIILNYGLLLGLALVILNVVNYSFGDIYEQSPIVGAIGYALFIGFIVKGIRDYKALNNGFLKIGEAFKIGLGVALIAGIIISLYQYILMTYLEPDFIAKAAEVQERIMLETNPDMSDDQLDMALKMSEMISKPTILTALRVISNLIGGLIVALVTGLIMKKEADLY